MGYTRTFSSIINQGRTDFTEDEQLGVILVQQSYQSEILGAYLMWLQLADSPRFLWVAIALRTVPRIPLNYVRSREHGAFAVPHASHSLLICE